MLRKLAHQELKDFEHRSVGIKAETFVETRSQQAVIFHFQCKERGDKVEVILDKDSGALVQLGHTPGKPSGKTN